MKPILSHRAARRLIRFSGNGKAQAGNIFILSEGEWKTAIAHGGRDYKGRYYLCWCWATKFEITVGTLAEIIQIITLGPKEASKKICKALQQAASQLGLKDTIVLHGSSNSHPEYVVHDD